MEIDWARGDVILVDDVEVAHARRSWFRDRAEVQIGPELWTYRAQGWTRVAVVAELEGAPRFSARRSGLFMATWTIDAGEGLTLTQASWFSSRLTVSRSGAPIGSCVRSGLLNDRPRLELAEQVDVRLVCFLLWLAYREYNRRSSDGGAA